MIINAEPSQEPLISPLKRSRSQSVHDEDNNNEHHRDEKRLKIEPIEEYEIVDIASLVQKAEASVMQGLMPEPDLGPDNTDISLDILNAINDTHVKPDHHDVSREILNAINQAHVKPDDDNDDDNDNDNDISQDILNAINEAQARSVHPHSDPGTEEETPPDTIWSHPIHYTRRKHIIPALGHLVSSAFQTRLDGGRLRGLLGC